MATTANATRPLTAADQPKQRLGAAPKITSADEANLALREMGFLRDHAATVNAARDQALREATAEINARFDAQLVVKIAGNEVPYADRASQLHDAVEAWAEEEHAGVKSGEAKKRSLNLLEGKISWQKARDAVVFAANKNASTVIAAIDKALEKEDETGVMEQLHELLDQIEVTIGDELVPVAELVKVSLSVERTKLLEAFKAKRVSRDALRAIGCLFELGRDYFKAEPNEYKPPDVG